MKTGIFSKLFHRKPADATYVKPLDGWAPIYPQFGDNIYASDIVRQCISCIVKEIKKLRPVHLRYKDTDSMPVKGTLQDILNQPNPLMTTTDFLEKCAWLLLLNCNCFCVPVYKTWTGHDEDGKPIERRVYEAIYPIKPTQVDFIEDASGRMFVHFWFANGYDTTIPYENVIHLRYDYSVNDFMGGGVDGQPDNLPILETLKLNHKLLHGLATAMNAAYTINAAVKYNTMLDDGKIEANLRRFEQLLKSSESGILPIDMKSELVVFPKSSVKLLDADTLKFLDEKILRNWGVPLCILTGDYTKEQYEAFYQKTIEPLVITLTQAFTKGLFTTREKALGNRVEFLPEKLVFMSISQIIEMVKELSQTGGLYENEKRVAFGLPPLEELKGKRYMSLNWINADDASAYQVGNKKNVNVDIVDEEKEDV